MGRDSLETRLGARCLDALAAAGVAVADLDLAWSDGSVELMTGELDAATADALLTSPLVTTTRELHWNAPRDDVFVGDAAPMVASGARALRGVLAMNPRLESLAVSGERVSLAGATHPTLWQLHVAADAWPDFTGASLPGLRRLQLVVHAGLDLAALTDVLAHVAPGLEELWLGGDAMPAQLAALTRFAPFARLARLRLEAGVIDVPRAKALLDAPGVLAELPHLELGGATWEAMPWVVALERKEYALGRRWTAVCDACFGPIDPAMRLWWWFSSEEGRASGLVAWLPRYVPASTIERDLLAAVDRGEPGSDAVLADWREEQGLDRRWIAPRSVEEATFLLCAARLRVSKAPRPADLTDEDLADIVRFTSRDHVPIERGALTEILPAAFDEKVRWLVDMMREAPRLRVTENGAPLPGDPFAFEPPIGRAVRAIALRTVWNDMSYVAETTNGFALMHWATGA